MPTPREKGGTAYNREGIEPAKAFLGDAEAYRDYMIELSRRITDLELRIEFLEILNKQASAHNGIRDAVHTLDIIGQEAKQERLDNGTTQTPEGQR